MRSKIVDYIIFHVNSPYDRYLVEADFVCVFACLPNKFEVAAAEGFPDETP